MVLNSYFLPYIELFRVVSQYACGIFRCGQYLSLYSHHLAWYLAQIGLHTMFLKYCFCSVAQSCPTLRTPWTAACQASLSFTISWNLLKLTPIESMMPSNYLNLCRPFFHLPSNANMLYWQFTLGKFISR